MAPGLRLPSQMQASPRQNLARRSRASRSSCVSCCPDGIPFPECSYGDGIALETKNVLVCFVYTQMNGTGVCITERHCYEQQSLSLSRYFSHREFSSPSSSSARS